MCIIAYVKPGMDVSEERIRFMFKGNPDGAGLMWKPTPNSEVEIRKGFMTVEALIKAYKQIPKTCERAMHMRIATAGKVSVDCCHPFPVRRSVELMRNGVDRTDVALMHNGIISYCNPKGGMTATYSDSMAFASTYLYHFKNILSDVFVQDLLERSTTSRLLIMRKGAETIMLGDWKTDDGGIMYSNGNYKPVEYKYTTYGSSSNPYSYSWGSSYTFGKTTEKKAETKSAKQEVLDDIIYAVNNDKYRNNTVTFALDATDMMDLYAGEGLADERCRFYVEEDIWEWLDRAEIDYTYSYTPVIEDVDWSDDGKTFYVCLTGLPTNTRAIAGYNVIDAIEYKD